MAYRTKRLISTLAGATLLVAGGLAFGAGSAFAGGHPNNSRHTTLFVAPGGNSHHRGGSCRQARFAAIEAAVVAAAPGSTVRVCPGTYHEGVVVPKTIRLLGWRATIDAAGAMDSNGLPAPGIVIAASGVEVSGFTVENSIGEGILAVTVSRVDIEHNVVKHNDQGTPTSPYQECQPMGQTPGDCGEAVHLMGVTHSRVQYNDVTDNSGGILLTDETGPNHDNLIQGNRVHDNLYDCGITIPSHVPGPGHGVYRNTVRNNVVTGNGVRGEGAGVLIATAGPGMAAYDNLVTRNYIAGNGMSGVTIHGHAPGENLNGNRIIGNVIGRNNVTGDGAPGDFQTTGVLVFSQVVPATVTIRANVIVDNTFGVWLSQNITAHNVERGNLFLHVQQRVHRAPQPS